MRKASRFPARLMTVGLLAAVSLLAGTGAAAAGEWGGVLAMAGVDPVGDLVDPITDEIEDTTDPITDDPEDRTDPITDQLEDTTEPITDQLEDTTEPITDQLEDTTEPITEQLGGTTDPLLDTTGGAGDPAWGPATGSSEGAAAHTRDVSVASRTREGRTSLSSVGADTDEVATSGDRVLEGMASENVCIGIVPGLCLDLVGGSGWLGVLYRAFEEGREIFSPIPGSLPLTGGDLLAIIGLVLLTGVAGAWMVRRGGRDEQPGHRHEAARPRA